MQHHKTVLSVIAGIMITGWLLNLANKGTLGSIPASVSKSVTDGYGGSL